MLRKRHRRKRSRSSSPHDDLPGSTREFTLPESWTTQADSRGTQFFIEAYEADIITSVDGAHHTLEKPDSGDPKPGEKGSALLRWCPNQQDAHAVWVDRYDARLLLSSPPRREAGIAAPVDLGSAASPPSPSGWSDLPSDSEDTFFFTPSETSEFRHNKRRKILDAAQNERLKALREREGGDDPEEVGKEVWGDDNEEPDESQKELMRRTATHIASSPDPVLLEMRILTNHGNDRRFAFLRGRWKTVWQRMKTVAKAEITQNETAEPRPPVGMNLADYGDSDEEQSDGGSGVGKVDSVPEDPAVKLPLFATESEEQAKAARRIRAKEWSARRQAEKSDLKKQK